MSDQPSCNRATILFDGALRLNFVDLAEELQRPFRNIALEFDQTSVAEGSHVVFLSEAMIVRVGYAPQDDWTTKFADANRPAQAKVSKTIIDTLLEDVRTVLEVTVEDGPERAMNERTRLAACYHVVRHLMRQHEASMVYWNLSDTLFTTEEFENPTALSPVEPAPAAATATGAAPFPRRPQRVAASGRVTPRPQMAGFAPAGQAAFATAEMQVDATHARLDQSFAEAVHLRDTDATIRNRMRQTYHDDARDEERLRRARHEIFADDLIESRDSRRPPPPEEIGLLEQLTVYVMTVTIMVLSFPAGFAMLIYTVLRGENLNMTARAMALTGIGVGFTSPQVTAALMQFI
ncbi:hypothetical protein [Actibacterium sp.]|uniref:hypothetical protein n=1 Tax=Actibacterium sp. TaxID=1872125 RepID=UPI0035627403